MSNHLIRKPGHTDYTMPGHSTAYLFDDDLLLLDEGVGEVPTLLANYRELS